MQRTDRIRTLLTDEFAPTRLEIEDQSHLHAGHAGARDGRGHFHISIVSEKFTKLSLLQRHRLVYATLAEMMKTDIHALGIDAISPSD